INGRSDFAFGLVAGTNLVGNFQQAVYFGWKDGTTTATPNPDVLPFTASGESVVISTLQPASVAPGTPFPASRTTVGRSYSVTFNITRNATPGNTLGDRGFDHAGGAITIGREFPATGTFTTWSLNAAPSSVGRSITPLLLQRQPDNSYIIV